MIQETSVEWGGAFDTTTGTISPTIHKGRGEESGEFST